MRKGGGNGGWARDAGRGRQPSLDARAHQVYCRARKSCQRARMRIQVHLPPVPKGTQESPRCLPPSSIVLKVSSPPHPSQPHTSFLQLFLSNRQSGPTGQAALARSEISLRSPNAEEAASCSSAGNPATVAAPSLGGLQKEIGRAGKRAANHRDSTPVLGPGKGHGRRGGEGLRLQLVKGLQGCRATGG